MTARTYAAICGALYLALGLAGFVPPLWERPPAGPALTIRVFYASLFGVFVVNIILSMMHLVIGLWAAMSANNRYSSLVFARAGTILFVVMGVAGLIPVDEVRTLYGTTPLYGNNVWLHFGTAVVGAFFSFRPGYRLSDIGTQEAMNPHMGSK
jgi:hypothetical protein